MVELPTVDVFQRILRQAIANCAQVQAQLPDVLEAHLVPNRPVNGEQLDKAVLRGA